jgi:hypothetical protein
MLFFMLFFLINRVPTSALKDKSPYEVLYNELPNLTGLKVFGSRAYATTLQTNRTKLSHRGRKCIYLGNKKNVKGVILYDLNSREIFVSRHVTHHDHILPYQSSNETTWHYHTEYTSTHDHDQTNNAPNDPDLSETTDNTPSDTDLPETTNNTSSVILDKDNSPTPDTSNEAVEPTKTNPTQNNNASRPIRAKHAPSYLTDYVCNASADLSKSSSKGTKYHICDYHTFSNLSTPYHAYTLSITHKTEPTSYLEACKSEHWRQVMNLELDALTKTGS